MDITTAHDRTATDDLDVATQRPGDPAGRGDHDAGLAVDVRGLRHAYGSFESLRGIDLQARPGELLAVLGTNGAGKTTAIDVLRGTRGRDGGTVEVLGLDPQAHRRRLAARSGVVLQESALPSELTPAELLALWRQLAEVPRGHHPVDHSLRRVGLAHRGDVRIGQLSGGERRRLDLAVALSPDPELLFLDEPTAGLDPESRQDAWDLIRDVRRRGCTVVLTTHHLEEAEALADRLTILHAGEVVVAGQLDEVLAGRDARIRFRVSHDLDLPTSDLAGDVATTADGRQHQVAVRTSDLEHDLARLLAWARANDVRLHRLHASQPTLAEFFHDIRLTTPEEMAR